jgi:hypothetical protein
MDAEQMTKQLESLRAHCNKVMETAPLSERIKIETARRAYVASTSIDFVPCAMGLVLAMTDVLEEWVNKVEQL